MLLSAESQEECGTLEGALSTLVPMMAQTSLPPPQFALDCQSIWNPPLPQRPWVLPVREKGNARIFWSMDGVWSIRLKKFHVFSAFTLGTVGRRDRSPRRKACQICFKMFCMALNLQKWRCRKPRAKWAAVQTDRDLILWKHTKGQPVGLFNCSPWALCMQLSLQLSVEQAVVTWGHSMEKREC